jgi:uncharacterized small protein (DUF1192 family)
LTSLVAAPASTTNNERDLDQRAKLASSEVANLEKRRTILMGEIRRLEAELKSRTQRLRALEKTETEAREKLEAPEQERSAINSTDLVGEVSRSELQSIESNLLSSMNGIDQVLEEARQLISDLQEPDQDRKKPSNSFLSTMKILESLDAVILRKQIDKDKGALFVICPQCRERVDIRRNLKLKKKKGSILFSCIYCESKTDFSLPGLVRNMVESNS